MATATPEDKYTVYPKNVKKDMEDLDAMFEEQKKAKEKTQAPPPETSVEEPIETPSVEEPTEVEVETPVEEPTDVVPKGDFEKSEQRYRTLQEKYNKEIPDLHSQVRFLYQQNQNLQRQIGEVQTPKPVEQKPQAKVSFRENPKVKALKEELAPEVFENLVGAMEETTETLRKNLEEEREKIRSEFSTTLGKTRDEIFWETVYSNHEDYDQLRDNTKFQEFLTENEGLSGLSRGDFFINAYNKRDSKTYMRYLNAFKKQNEETPPADKKLGSSGPNPDKLKAKIGAPRGTGSASNVTPPPSSENKMTPEEAEAELDKMAMNLNKGLWRGTMQDYDKKEAALWKIIRGG